MDSQLTSFQTMTADRMKAAWRVFADTRTGGYREAGPWASYSIASIDRVLFRGKAIRGMLVYLGAAVTGRTPDADTDALALASELVQLSLLIHDDIMDRDTLRRGMPSLHVAARDAAPFTDPGRSGENIAICVGDAGFFLAEALAASVNRPDILTLMGMEYARVTAAQIADVTLADIGGIPPREQIMAVYENKTGRYSIGLPLVAGAMLGRASAETVSGLWSFSRHAGIAFQLRDDWLNLYGDPAVTGKPVGSDLREGKKTLAVALAYEAAGDTDRTRIGQLLGTERVGDLLELFAAYDIRGQIERMTGREADAAVSELSGLGQSAAVPLLEKLCTYLTRRPS